MADDLVLGRARKLVAGDLFDDELVVGQVAVKCTDHPVAVKVNLARLVFLVSVGIGVPRGIEPDPPPALAIMRRLEQPLDQLVVGVGTPIGPKGVDLRESPAAARSRRGSSRRIKVTLSASGEGLSPSASSRARMNRSIGVRHQAAFFTEGSGGRCGGRNAQCP